MVLDDLDRRLIELLREDARRSFRQLASLADSTPPTVAARIKRMEEIGIILGYTLRLDPQRFPDATQTAIAPLGDAVVACHQCSQQTSTPVWLRLDGKRHPFCCPTCQQAYDKRYHQFKQGTVSREDHSKED